jgi:iron complex outermembrane receptor protein
LTTDSAIPAKPEYVWNYELGLKSKFLEGRAQANFALFHQDLKDKQEQVVVAVGVTSERNATSAKIDGLEAELEFIPVERFRLTATASFLNTKYGTFIGSPSDVGPGESYIYTGNELPFAPKVQASVVPAYTFPLGAAGGLTAQAEWIHASSVFFTRINDPREGNGGYSDYNFRLIWHASQHLDLSAYGENLSNERHAIQTQPFLNQGLGLPTEYNTPRQYGVQFSFKL